MSERVKWCNEICLACGITRNNYSLGDFTTEELFFILSYLRVCSDLSDKILKKLKSTKG